MGVITETGLLIGHFVPTEHDKQPTLSGSNDHRQTTRTCPKGMFRTRRIPGQRDGIMRSGGLPETMQSVKVTPLSPSQSLTSGNFIPAVHTCCGSHGHRSGVQGAVLQEVPDLTDVVHGMSSVSNTVIPTFIPRGEAVSGGTTT